MGISIKTYCEDNYVGLKFLRSYALCYGLTGLCDACDMAITLVDNNEPIGMYLKYLGEQATKSYFSDMAANAIYRLVDDYGIPVGCVPPLSCHYSVRTYIKEICSLL